MRIIVYPHLMTVGGSQLNAIELAAAVRDRGHEVTVFAAETGPLAETVERLGLPLVLAPRHKKRPSIPIARALRALCRRERIDIVHGYEWPTCVEAFFGPLLCDGVTVGCTVMSMSVAPFIPASVPLIVGTEQIAAAARQSRSGPVRVIEPPVDTTANHPDIDGRGFRARYGLGDGPMIVLVSRLVVALKLEGIERAIRAMELLAPETGAQLVIVGDGPARAHLERVAAGVNAATGASSVVLTGELADPRPAYAAADVLLGMGGSALRAMAFAKPVIVLGELGFAEPLTPETADRFLWQGFYGLGDGDQRPESFAALLRPLLVDRAERVALGDFARQFVDPRFGLVAAAERQELLYREWLTHHTARGILATEAARTTAQVLTHKVRQRLDRWRGRESTEDFNAVAEIAKTAELAERARADVEHIPLVDLKAQHAAVADEVATGFASVLERTAFVLGDEVDAFEREFAAFSGAAHCVGVGNGTDAVELALRAVGIGAGSEVILPANTFIATAEAVVRAGAKPVLVDCDPVHQLIDVDAVEARADSATGAVVPVHLFGQLAPVAALRSRLGRSGPLIVEDAAQCQGATQDGAGPATIGVAAATSFYPGKNLGAYGEAGAVLSGDAEIARRLRGLRNHGSETKYEHPELGFNSRLDTLQAVVLRAKLARLAGWNEARRAAARRYDAMLAELDGVVPPATLPGNEHVWHLYVVRVPRRDAVLAALHEAGIGAGVHYPIPVHLQGAFRDLGHRPGDFPEAERAAGEILSLPLFPEITSEQQRRVVDALEKALV